MNKRIPVFETERVIKRQKEEEAERRAILEYEAMVKELTESFEKTMAEIEEEARRYGHGCNGHPAEEE